MKKLKEDMMMCTSPLLVIADMKSTTELKIETVYFKVFSRWRACFYIWIEHKTEFPVYTHACIFSKNTVYYVLTA